MVYIGREYVEMLEMNNGYDARADNGDTM